METVQESQRESNSEASLADCLKQLTPDQIRYVVARQEFPSDKETAEELGMKPDTVWHWPPVVKLAVRLMAEDGLVLARHIRRKALAKAMMVKVAGLDSKDDNLRQRVATEVIEWEMGRAQDSLDITSKGEQLLADVRAQIERRYDRLAATATERVGASGADQPAAECAAV